MSAPGSVPAWGADLVARLTLSGDETVLDAGCGSGRLLQTLLPLLPNGHVVGVDPSVEALDLARRAVPADVELHVQELSELVLSTPVDAVVSLSAFHRITDQDRLFERLLAVLLPGGRLEARCAGAGHVASVRAAIDRLRQRAPWREALLGWEDGWTFPGAEETAGRLRAAGFVDVACELDVRGVRPEDPNAYLRAMVLSGALERLPDETHDEFVEAVIAELDDGTGVVLEDVRLHLSAAREADGRPVRRRPDETPDEIATRLRR